MQEDDTEKTWDDTEMNVKKMIREKLGIEEDVKTERERTVLARNLTLFDMGGWPPNVFDHCAQTLCRRKLKLGDF